MSKETGSQPSASRGQTVPFGKNLHIQTGMRLPRHDNGDALAYVATDARNRSKRYIAIVAGIESLPRWTVASAYDGLADTSFMRMAGSGVINWPVDNKQKYVFVYHGEVGEPLVESGGFSKTTWRHPDIVEFFIQPMARMLKEMEGKGFYHGCIRPDNIFYSPKEKNAPIILGDCLATHSGSTQPDLFLSVDKALTDPMGRGFGTIKDDIYAFGISLALFLRKHDELDGLSDKEIVKKKIEFGTYATVIGTERFQASFLELLKGVLHDNESDRWGVEEIFAWLDGSRLTPAPMGRRKKANRPLAVGGKKYLFPDILAVDIQKYPNEIADMLESGMLDQWVEKAVDDKDMTERYRRAVERIDGAGELSDNKDYMTTQLRMALNPNLPLHYKGKCFAFDGLGGMLAMAIYRDQDLSFYREVLRLNLPDQASSVKTLSHNELMTVLKQFDSCRGALQQMKVGFGIERCVYILTKNAPCLSPKFKNYFVNGHAAALVSYESLCKAGGQTAILLDRHAIAFFSVLDSNLMERCLYDLNSPEKDNQILGNLRFLGAMQQRANAIPAPAIASVMLDSLSGVYKLYKHKGTRQRVKEGVEKAAKAGDLVGMSILMDDVNALTRDSKGYQRAKAEYKLLQNEYDEYNRRLSNKKTYGVPNGRDAAVLVSWSVSTLITLIVVFAYMSGYRIF